MTAETVQKKLLTAAEFAAEYEFSLGTVRYWVTKGTGPRSARVGRRRMFRREDIEAWLEAQWEGER